MFLKKLFRIREDNLKNSYDLKVEHNPSDGRFREELIKTVLEVTPQRYSVSNGFVIDSLGNLSKEIDLIIYDDVYVPRFLIDTYSVIPIESVVAIVQVKTVLDKQKLEDAIENLSSIDILVPSLGGRIISASQVEEIKEQRSIAPLKVLVTGTSKTPLKNNTLKDIDIVYSLKGEDYNNLYVKKISSEILVSKVLNYDEMLRKRKETIDFDIYKNNKLFNFSISLMRYLTLINNSLILNYTKYLKGDDTNE